MVILTIRTIFLELDKPSSHSLS